MREVAPAGKARGPSKVEEEIVICCDDMGRAMDQGAIVKTAKHDIRDGRIRNDITSEYFLRAGPEGGYDYFALNYCPFCGKAISLGLWHAEKKK